MSSVSDTFGAVADELVPATVVVAAKAGEAKPNAEIDAPVRNAIRRERLVIFIPLLIAATQGNTANPSKGTEAHQSTVATAI
jgi:hypothetical protein